MSKFSLGQRLFLGTSATDYLNHIMGGSPVVGWSGVSWFNNATTYAFGVIMPARFLQRRFATLSSVGCLGSVVLIPLFIALGARARAWAVAVGFTYTLAVSVLVLALAISYLSTQEWHYLWRSARLQVGAPVPDTAIHHGRLAFLAERALGPGCIFCAGLGLIGVAAGVGAAAWPAAVAGSAAFLVMFTAMMRDMTDDIRAQFRRRRE